MKVVATMRNKMTKKEIGTREFKSIEKARKWAIDAVSTLNTAETKAIGEEIEITVNPINKFSPETY